MVANHQQNQQHHLQNPSSSVNNVAWRLVAKVRIQVTQSRMPKLRGRGEWRWCHNSNKSVRFQRVFRKHQQLRLMEAGLTRTSVMFVRRRSPCLLDWSAITALTRASVPSNASSVTNSSASRRTSKSIDAFTQKNALISVTCVAVRSNTVANCTVICGFTPANDPTSVLSVARPSSNPAS